jgi:hypothetical protein
MKKIKLALVTSLFVMGIFATFAFKPAETTSGSDPLYWYDADSGELLNNGQPTEVAPTTCQNSTQIPCVYGVSFMTDDPAGDAEVTINKD